MSQNAQYAISRGEGGGSEAQMIKFTAAIQKPFTSWQPNFVTFSFIFKTCSDQILAKLINQGVTVAHFLSRPRKNSENEKISSAWRLLKLTLGGGGGGRVNFGSKRTILDIKSHFLKVKFIFPGVNTRI